MSTFRLLPLVLVFVFTVSLYAQVPPQSEVNGLLERTAQALDRYEAIALQIRCEDESEPLRDNCEAVVKRLGEDVQATREQITRYSNLSNPQPVDLFDIYQVLHRIMDGVQEFAFAEELGSGANRMLSIEAYNNFVKIDGWFGGEVRTTIADTPCKSQ